VPGAQRNWYWMELFWFNSSWHRCVLSVIYWCIYFAQF